jgi:glycosyltransferase involved in cell wall biosynthesis
MREKAANKIKKIEFYSSTEYSGFLASLVQELQQAGIDARQCYLISEKRYRDSKSFVARLYLRLRQYFLYPIWLSVRLFRRFLCRRLYRSGGDVCVVSTNTFYAPLIATFLHPNVVHLVYDLFPEAMIHSGKWQEGALKVRIVRWLVAQTFKRAQLNIFLGERLKEYAESTHGQQLHSKIIPVGADQSLFSKSPNERITDIADRCSAAPLKPEEACVAKSPKPSFTVLYCGNFGNMHDSDTLVGYWQQLASQHVAPSHEESILSQNAQAQMGSEITWKFCCSGPKRKQLEFEIKGLPNKVQDQIKVSDGLGQAEWIAEMNSADIALVTMVPGSETVVMPSKTYSAMMAGQAILAIAPKASDLVDLVTLADCGWFVMPGDTDQLSLVLDQMKNNPVEILRKRENAYRYAHRHFSQTTLAKQWIQSLEDAFQS